MVGQRRAGLHAQPRHARVTAPRTRPVVAPVAAGLRGTPAAIRGGVLLLAVAIAALAAAVLLAGSPASAEGSRPTATLTLTGVRDSNCDLSTGGTTVYVAPGGTVTFKADLAGLTINVGTLLGINIGQLDISSSLITSFNDKLIINGDTRHPHYVAEGKTFVWHNVGKGTHSLSWSANSITVTVPVLNQKVVVPLNANNVGLPAGGHLDWVGKLIASTNTKCGVSIELPGGGGSVGPISVSVPPITNIPTVPVTLPHLPGGGGGGGGGSSSHPGGGGGSSSGGGGGGHSGGPTYTSGPTAIPELVVPHPGGGDSAFGGGVGGFGQALPDNGGSIGPVQAGAVTSTAAAPGASSSASKGKPVDLANNATDDGLGGTQLPVLLAIVAIIALSLVTAAYARMYLMRRPPV